MTMDEYVKLAHAANDRASAASVMPWTANHAYEMFMGSRHAVEGPRNGALITGIAGAVEWATSPCKETERSIRQRTMAAADAEFIANARADVPALAAAVLALVARVRELESRGPVMPETPSDDLVWLIVGNSSLPGAELMLRGFYNAIRAALMKEQAGV